MPPPSVTVVIAQCVQPSFLSPLPGPDPRLKPCRLHCGYANAVRLLGDAVLPTLEECRAFCGLRS